MLRSRMASCNHTQRQYIELSLEASARNITLLQIQRLWSAEGVDAGVM
jgi:hypothetical protein